MYINNYSLKIFLGIILVFCVGVANAYPEFSKSEKKFQHRLVNPSYNKNMEKIATVILSNQEELGKLAALKFIEWVHDNPQGVVSLPVGKTSEFFIRYVMYFKGNWKSSDVQAVMKKHSLDYLEFPNLSQIKLVQPFELFPVALDYNRSVRNFLIEYYVKPFGLKDENVLLMPIVDRGILKKKGLDVVFRGIYSLDLSLMSRPPKNKIEEWQKRALHDANAFCTEYEEKVRQWGGIGLFIDSLGYKGELSLNQFSTQVLSSSRVVYLDDRAAAYLAKELNSYDFAKRNIGITIGLETIYYNKNVTVILLVSGAAAAAKAKELIEGNVLLNLPNNIRIKFNNIKVYITEVAARDLGTQLMVSSVGNVKKIMRGSSKV